VIDTLSACWSGDEDSNAAIRFRLTGLARGLLGGELHLGTLVVELFGRLPDAVRFRDLHPPTVLQSEIKVACMRRLDERDAAGRG
jgi:hypothetical protein